MRQSILIISAVLLFFPVFTTGQDLARSSAAGDTTALALDAESYYAATRLRIIRWLRKSAAVAPIDQLTQIVDLQEQADRFAAAGDHETAQLILDTALDLAQVTSATPASPDSETPPPASHGWQWTREVVAGLDYWQQEFELGFSDEDSLFQEKNGNPFTGLRLHVQRSTDAENFFSAYSLIKASRDYTSGEVELRSRRAFGGKSSGLFMNRLEGTRYTRDLDLQYWHNSSRLGVAFLPARQLRIEIADELRYRGYRQQSSSYPNYLHNQIRLGGAFVGGASTRIDAAYDYAVRAHPTFSENDYFEHRVDAAVSQATATNSSIYLQNVWRRRDYARGFSDSTYQNTYQEEYLRGDIRIGLSPKVAIRVEGDYTLRQYEIPSSNTPDYANTYINPQFLFKFLGDWQFGAGYMYLLRVHDKDIVRSTPSPVVDSRSAESGYVGFEDYYSHGVTVSLDLFQISGLMVSLNDTYEIRKYPNSTTNDLPGLGLYTDRNINNLLLFLTMNWSSRLQMTVLANLDDDRSRVGNQSDSKSTLFSVDLGYSF